MKSNIWQLASTIITFKGPTVSGQRLRRVFSSVEHCLNIAARAHGPSLSALVSLVFDTLNPKIG